MLLHERHTWEVFLSSCLLFVIVTAAAAQWLLAAICMLNIYIPSTFFFSCFAAKQGNREGIQMLETHQRGKASDISDSSTILNPSKPLSHLDAGSSIPRLRLVRHSMYWDGWFESSAACAGIVPALYVELRRSNFAFFSFLCHWCI